jgi:hypothetical protein
MDDHLAMDGTALLIHVLGVQRIVAVQFGQFRVRKSIPFDVALGVQSQHLVDRAQDESFRL